MPESCTTVEEESGRPVSMIVRNAAEYETFRQYIHWNPVKRGLASKPEEYVYGSASGGTILDPLPQRLKPVPDFDAERSAEELLDP